MTHPAKTDGGEKATAEKSLRESLAFYIAEMLDWAEGRRSWTNLGPHEPYTPDVVARMDAAEVAKHASAIDGLRAAIAAQAVVQLPVDLREYFAAQALAGIMARPDNAMYDPKTVETDDAWRQRMRMLDATHAVAVADALIAALAQEVGNG